MNNEIKEILEELNKFPYGKFYGLRQEQVNQISKLLDYITNLQQENERLKQTQYVWSYDLDMQLEDYKTRCEKGIEFIKKAIENDEYFEDDIATDISEPSYDKYVNSNDLLNILQNGSENE